MRRRSAERGQATVELALTIPLLFLILVLLLDFGRMMGTYLIVQHSAREAARLAISGVSDAEVETRARAILEDLLTDGASAVVTVDPAGAARLPGDTVTVSVTYDLQLINPVISAAGYETWRLDARYAVRVE